MKSYTRLLNEIHPKAWMCDAEKFLGDSELSENAYLEIDYNIESIYNFPNILDYINPEIRNELRKSQRIIMVETILENIKESYYVDMQIVDKIPVDWSQIGLKTWDEVALAK